MEWLAPSYRICKMLLFFLLRMGEERIHDTDMIVPNKISLWKGGHICCLFWKQIPCVVGQTSSFGGLNVPSVFFGWLNSGFSWTLPPSQPKAPSVRSPNGLEIPIFGPGNSAGFQCSPDWATIQLYPAIHHPNSDFDGEHDGKWWKMLINPRILAYVQS